MTIREIYEQIKDKDAASNLFDLLSQRAPVPVILEAVHGLGNHDAILCSQIIDRIKAGEKFV